LWRIRFGWSALCYKWEFLCTDWDWVIITTALSYVIGIVALFVVPHNRKPGEATAWLLLIFLAPFLGRSYFSCNNQDIIIRPDFANLAA